MRIPTEPIGSIPRPRRLIDAMVKGAIRDPSSDPGYEQAVQETIARLEATGSPVITDGEQRKFESFWTYSVHGSPNTAPDGFTIPFSDGHTRRMPRLTAGPFRYMRYADSYLDVAMRYATRPVKQAVISPSALSLLYPADELRVFARRVHRRSATRARNGDPRLPRQRSVQGPDRLHGRPLRDEGRSERISSAQFHR